MTQSGQLSSSTNGGGEGGEGDDEGGEKDGNGILPGDGEGEQQADIRRFGWFPLPGTDLGTFGHQHWSGVVSKAFGLTRVGLTGFFLHHPTSSIFFGAEEGFFISTLDCEYIWYVADTFSGSLPVLRGEQDPQGPCRPSGEVFNAAAPSIDIDEYERAILEGDGDD